MPRKSRRTAAPYRASRGAAGASSPRVDNKVGGQATFLETAMGVAAKYGSGSMSNETREHAREELAGHPLRVELKDALVRGNRWLHKWHMENDAPPDTAPLFAGVIQEWYEREDAFRRLFSPEGCALGDEGPCLIPAECAACR